MVGFWGNSSNQRTAGELVHRRPAELVGESTSTSEEWLTNRPQWQQFAVLALLAGIYFILGLGGLHLALGNVSVAMVWPATGFAIAALLLLGQRVWPAVAVGAFLLNLSSTGAFISSLGIAAGSVGEAYFASWAARRWANGWRAFERAQDILRFAVCGVFLATLLSATLGVVSLWMFNIAKGADYSAIWASWWLSHAVGAFVVTPVIVLMATLPAPRWNIRQWVEAALLFSGVFIVGDVLFGGLVLGINTNYPLTFVSIPFLFWTAFRFGPREASLTTFVLAVFAIGGATQGHGRFAAMTPQESMVLTSAFLGVIALTTLGVSASVAESRRLESLAAQLAAIVASSNDAIVGKSLKGLIVSWNRGAERLYGYTADEAIGKSVSLLSPRADTAEYLFLLPNIIRQEPIEPFETIRRRKDGTLVNVSLTISPVLNAHGHVIGASAISRDITQQKQTEVALVEANDKLKLWLDQLEREAHEITLLNQMSGLLQTSLTEQEIGAVVRQFADRLFPGDSGAVCVRGPAADLVETICSWGNYPPSEQVFNRSDCWALRHGQLHAVNDVRVDIVCPHWTRGPWPASALCVPMMAQGDSLGVLLLRQPAALPAESGSVSARSAVSREQLAVTVAGHVALAISNLRLRETLRLQSIRDSLTGLYNRRYLNEVLDREVRRAARGQRHLAVLLLDVDGFKGLNDTYGHEAGDSFLRELGNFLQKRVREEDIACRYGGDEFVIMLTETSQDAARRRGKQLLDGIRALSIPHRGRYLTSPTISLGVALYPDHGGTSDELFRAADDALYKAKARGRDCMVISGSGPGLQAREKFA